jgi:WD40 repeat protein
MNNLLNHIPSEEQPVASRLASVAEDMQVSPTFQWELENQLMDKYRTQTRRLAPAWHTKIHPALGWALLAIAAVFLLDRTMRSLIPNPLGMTVQTPTQEPSFAESVRSGNICAGPLAVAHNFSVALSNADKTSFIPLDEQQTIGELRSFAWSADGSQLAVAGNTTGSGNIYLMDANGKMLQPVLSDSNVGYLMGMARSRDGKQFIIWSSQNISTLYLVNEKGENLTEIQLDAQIFGTPQFAPDGQSILFYGADSSGSDGLLQSTLDGSQTRVINDLVEDENGFAFSPDGTRLAYMEMDRNLGEAHLVVEETVTGSKVVLASLTIPKGSSSSIPTVANLSWSPDGTSIVFDFGTSASSRAIYLAHTDGRGLVKLIESAYAPTVSADGRCLAYISDRQVFVVDMANTSANSITTPVLLADLPDGRGIAGFQLDKLQWKP